MKPFVQIKTQLINLNQVKSVELHFNKGGKDGVCIVFRGDYYILFWDEDAEVLRRFFSEGGLVEVVSENPSDA